MSAVQWKLYRYVDENGTEPFSAWLNKCDRQLQRRVRVALARIEIGNFSSIKWISGNLGEFRLDFGPGYRIYLARYGKDGIVLLAGGDKSSQERDISRARDFVASLKARG
jgi:putative addiction module killer protein